MFQLEQIRSSLLDHQRDVELLHQTAVRDRVMEAQSVTRLQFETKIEQLEAQLDEMKKRVNAAAAESGHTGTNTPHSRLKVHVMSPSVGEGLASSSSNSLGRTMSPLSAVGSDLGLGAHSRSPSSASSSSILSLHATLQSKIEEIQQLHLKLAHYERIHGPLGTIVHRESIGGTSRGVVGLGLPPPSPQPSAGLTPFSSPSRRTLSTPSFASPTGSSSSTSAASDSHTLTFTLRVVHLSSALVTRPIVGTRHLVIALFRRAVTLASGGSSSSLLSSPTRPAGTFHFVTQTDRQRIIGFGQPGNDLRFEKPIVLRNFHTSTPAEWRFSIYAVSEVESSGDGQDGLEAKESIHEEVREKIGSVTINSYHLLTGLPVTATAIDNPQSPALSATASPPPLLLPSSDNEDDDDDDAMSTTSTSSSLLHKLNLELYTQRELASGSNVSHRSVQRQVLGDRLEPLGGGMTRLIIEAMIEPVLEMRHLPPQPRVLKKTGLTPKLSGRSTPLKQ